jgi:hypothetical protein
VKLKNCSVCRWHQYGAESRYFDRGFSEEKAAWLDQAERAVDQIIGLSAGAFENAEEPYNNA